MNCCFFDSFPDTMGLNTCFETATGSGQKKGTELQIGPESRIRYAHLLAVFGNGPAGDAQTFLLQDLCDLIIAHRACTVTDWQV